MEGFRQLQKTLSLGKDRCRLSLCRTNLEDLLKRVELLEKQKVKTYHKLDRVQKSVTFIKSGRQEPTESA